MEIDGLIALQKRLGKEDENRPRVEERLYNLQAGFGGETQYDKYLTEFKPRYPHAILHDVTLCEDNIYFQMDSVLITPAFIVISEVKNIAEKIVVKSKPLQFVKEYYNGKRIPLKNPVVELERKIHLFDSWLKKHKVDIPINGIIAFAYNNELFIEETPSMHIMFTYEVAAHLRTLPVTHEIISKPVIHSLAKKIASSHKEFYPFPLIKRYSINPRKIKPGIFCPTCNSLYLKRANNKWTCPYCAFIGKLEHESALRDWSMLIKNTITNREFCYFTCLDNRHTAKRLLAMSPTELLGNGRGSQYEILLTPSQRAKHNSMELQ